MRSRSSTRGTSVNIPCHLYDINLWGIWLQRTTKEIAFQWTLLSGSKITAINWIHIRPLLLLRLHFKSTNVTREGFGSFPWNWSAFAQEEEFYSQLVLRGLGLEGEELTGGINLLHRRDLNIKVPWCWVEEQILINQGWMVPDDPAVRQFHKRSKSAKKRGNNPKLMIRRHLGPGWNDVRARLKKEPRKRETEPVRFSFSS